MGMRIDLTRTKNWKEINKSKLVFVCYIEKGNGNGRARIDEIGKVKRGVMRR